jgi:hypothetical protein
VGNNLTRKKSTSPNFFMNPAVWAPTWNLEFVWIRFWIQRDIPIQKLFCKVRYPADQKIDLSLVTLKAWIVYFMGSVVFICKLFWENVPWKDWQALETFFLWGREEVSRYCNILTGTNFRGVFNPPDTDRDTDRERDRVVDRDSDTGRVRDNDTDRNIDTDTDTDSNRDTWKIKNKHCSGD